MLQRGHVGGPVAQADHIVLGPDCVGFSWHDHSVLPEVQAGNPKLLGWSGSRSVPTIEV